MNKKIYFNNKFILLEGPDTQSSQDQHIKKYTDYAGENLEKIIDEFLNEPGNNSIKIEVKNFDEIFDRLKKIFYYIEAAGGFIEKDEKFLFIHRHKRWDLPKGKLEKGEATENAAVRECEEECGVRNLNIIYPLSPTYHLYPYKKGHALKQTFWYYMRTNYQDQLTPQLEEDIDEVRWFSKGDIESFIIKETYFTISDIIREALKLN